MKNTALSFKKFAICFIAFVVSFMTIFLIKGYTTKASGQNQQKTVQAEEVKNKNTTNTSKTKSLETLSQKENNEEGTDKTEAAESGTKQTNAIALTGVGVSLHQIGTYEWIGNIDPTRQAELIAENEINALYNEAYNAVINAGIYEGMDQAQAWNAIQNFILSNCQYDYSYSNRGWVDILKYKTAVCNGYAELAQVMCYICNIPCQVIEGFGDGGNHAWNRVCLGGTWFYTDLTWVDCGCPEYALSQNLWGDHVQNNAINSLPYVGSSTWALNNIHFFHDYKQVNYKLPTSTEDGYVSYQCSCGAAYQEVLPCKHHSEETNNVNKTTNNTPCEVIYLD